MVLLHHIVEILALPDRDGRRVGLIVVGNRCRVAPTLINRDLLREPMGPNRLAYERLGGVPIASMRQQKIKGVARCGDRAIQVFPLAFAAHVSLIPPPPLSHRLLPATELLFKLWRILADPAIEDRMID